MEGRGGAMRRRRGGICGGGGEVSYLYGDRAECSL